MTDIDWPLTVIPGNQEFWFEWMTSRTTSAFTGQQQIMGRPGAQRWRTKVSINRHDGISARAFDAFMTSLKGGLQPVLMPDFRRLWPGSPDYGSLQDWIDETYAVPVGISFDTGSYLDTASDGDAPFVAGVYDADVPAPSIAGAGGSRIVVRGLKPLKVAFVPGDLIQVSPGRVAEVAAEATADRDGCAFVTVNPRLRLAAAKGTLTFPARARMRLDASSAARNPTRAPVISSYEIELTEDLNV